MSFLFLSCNEIDMSSINKTLGSITDNQKAILRRLETIEKNQSGLKNAIAASNKPADNKKQKKPQADPNKVYDIAIGDSFVKGNPKAPITIIKWTDFQ